KHIMCQKPFARSVEEAEQMVSIAEAAGVRLMVTENWRWLEPFQIIKKLLAENIVGNMNVIRYTHTDFYSPRFAPEKELP
ncbi:Gfo/Idh/MocA family oxidoreductase, partial [Paenibacillus sp. EKM208P]